MIQIKDQKVFYFELNIDKHAKVLKTNDFTFKKIRSYSSFNRKMGRKMGI